MNQYATNDEIYALVYDKTGSFGRAALAVRMHRARITTQEIIRKMVQSC